MSKTSKSADLIGEPPVNETPVVPVAPPAAASLEAAIAASTQVQASEVKVKVPAEIESAPPIVSGAHVAEQTDEQAVGLLPAAAGKPNDGHLPTPRDPKLRYAWQRSRAKGERF